MSKILCETTGNFGLYHGNQAIEPGVPAVIERTEFFDARTMLGQVSILSNLRDEATNEEFKQYWKEAEGDRELAVASFLSAFGPVTAAPKKSNKR